jgi:hypothetical protein
MQGLVWKKVPWVTALLGATLAVSACSTDETSPSEVRQKVTAIIPKLTDDTLASFDFADDTVVWQRFDASLSSMNLAFPNLPFRFPAGEEDAPVPRDAAPVEPGTDPAGQVEEEFDGAKLAKALNEQIFIAGNYEGDGIYRLHGKDFCDNTDSAGEAPIEAPPGEPVPTPTEEPPVMPPMDDCVKNFDDAQIRLRVEMVGDGMDITILLGADRNELVTVELRPDRVALVVDLAEAKLALQTLASLSGDTIDLPKIMEGVVAVQLKRNGEKDVTVSAHVRAAVRVEGSLPEGRGDFAFATAAKDPIWSLHGEGVAKRITALLDVGKTTLGAPWKEMDGESLASGRLSVDWQGLSATAILEEAATSLKLTNLGLGDSTSTLKLDDKTLFSIDLNSTMSRHFGLTITPQETGLPTFALDPGFDLSLGFHLKPLADAGDVVDSYLLDETYGVSFVGDAPLAQPIEQNLTTGFPGGLKVTSGTLTITSSAATSAVTVAAGQCLVGDDLVTETEHPVLGQLSATDCP